MFQLNHSDAAEDHSADDSTKSAEGDDGEELLRFIRDSVIGSDAIIRGPYGPRRITYADYTASGRSLTFIEDVMRQHVMPKYANTHTESSGTGLQTSSYREDARKVIHEAVKGSDRDVVLFAGSGVTGAIDKIIGVLNWRIPKDLDEKFNFSSQIPDSQRPVVFVGPYEHHSNEVSWRETIADVVVIPEDHRGLIDQTVLKHELIKYKDREFKVGSFSAASNVTGILSDTVSIAALLHEHEALSFWDYASAGPYVEIDMNAKTADGRAAHKDAVFISPHKFVGGPGTPGILVAKHWLFQNTVPTIPGGGTVAFVSQETHEYLDDITQKEEGGTPAILESIRAGLVFKLKHDVGIDLIHNKEQKFVRGAIERWSKNPSIQILGNTDVPRLSIVSFLVRSPRGSKRPFLHHNFVVALLNDLFGIQSRGGCSCAGPYGHRLLKVTPEQSVMFASCIRDGYDGIKPGWTRVNFSYFLADETAQLVVDAVDWVARYGYMFLDDYSFNAKSGVWKHDEFSSASRVVLPPQTLSSFSFRRNANCAPQPHSIPVKSTSCYMEIANAELMEREFRRMKLSAPVPPKRLPEQVEKLLWFSVPREAYREAPLQDSHHKVKEPSRPCKDLNFRMDPPRL